MPTPRSPMKPLIKTPLPGPKARALLLKDERHVSSSYTRSYPFVMASGKGCWVTDVDGNRFLDLAAGIAVCAAGHGHPKVVAAVQEQAARFLHMSGTDFYYRPQVELAERLAKVAPGRGLSKVFFANSGAEAVEAAMKLARWHTGRPRYLAFQGAFHGRTFGALSLTASKAIHKDGFAPLLSEVTHIPYPNPLAPPFGRVETVVEDVLDYLERRVFSHLPAREFAACFVEPLQGEGGYVIPPAHFLPALKNTLAPHGILLVADEVQSGFGRTGKLFACEHSGVVPDILVLAKGIASGMPLGAIVSTPAIMRWPPGAHASTFGGNPVSCAAALATLDLLQGGLVDHAATVGAHFLAALETELAGVSSVSNPRGLGLWIAFDLVERAQPPTSAGKSRGKARKSPPASSSARDRLVQRLFERGLLTLGCGKHSLRLCPPLVISRQEAELAAAIIGHECRALE